MSDCGDFTEEELVAADLYLMLNKETLCYNLGMRDQVHANFVAANPMLLTEAERNRKKDYD